MSKRTLFDVIIRKKAKPTLPDWAAQLDQQGFCVVPNVLTHAECDSALAGVHSYLANAGVDIVTRKTKKDYPNMHGIIQHLEVGHSQAAWDVRTNESVQNVFAQIYGTNDLLVSFDGVCVMQPWHKFGRKSWMHMDQSSKNTARRCIQGYVNLTDASDARTGSLLVLPGSHKRFAEFFDAFPHMRKKSKGDWCKLQNEEQTAFFGVEKTRVHGGRGSLVLWDSRCVHQNIPPAFGPDEALQRCIVYTCYQPRELCSRRLVEKKIAAFDGYRMTTHWPAEKVKLFPVNARTYGAEVPVYTPVRDRVESQRMLELAGKVVMTSRAECITAPLLAFG